ncbi:hypothetical protein DFH09DRAFT_1079575 [Mycena vulgaris]|nr:hypothetical protein DFH09DRAFT_1079575 [Mycena vulgaris]
MDEDPLGRKNYQLCLYRAHDCVAQTWIAKDGSKRKGKWYSKTTVIKHRKEEKEPVEARVLPPATTHDQVIATLPVPKDKPPSALKIVRDEEDIMMEDDTGPATVRRGVLFLAFRLTADLR